MSTRSEPGPCDPDWRLDGRVAVVTGATGLLGRAICRALAARGADIVASHRRDLDDLATLAAEIEGFGVRCVTVQGDLTAPATVEQLRAAAARRLGRLDILVANAALKHRAAALMTNGEAVRDLFELNVEATFRLGRSLLRSMLPSRWGRLVVIGSRAGAAGHPGQAAYAATKAALEGWVRSVAGEIGDRGITVNLVAPGAIEGSDDGLHTPAEAQAVAGRIGLGRLGKPEEVAAVVAFLCSPAAGYVSGAVVPVDGAARF